MGGKSPEPRATRRRHPLARFVARRLAAGLLTLWVVSVLIFAATNVLPGNVATIVLGRNSNPAAVETLEQRLGLDQSLVSRYGDWLGGLVAGDLGESAVQLAQGAPEASIGESISSPLTDSLILAAITTILLVPLTLLLGAIAGVNSGRTLDHVISIPCLVLASLPEFVTGVFLIVIFFSALGLLPPVALLAPGQSPLSNPEALVLPVLTLLGVTLGYGVRQVRAGMAETMREDHVTVARLNGVSEWRLTWDYGLRNALGPTIQTLAQTIQYLIGGIIIVESVFDYPGLGQYLVSAVSTRDVTEVEAAALILATAYITINIVADLLVVLVTPRLRTSL
jgi:peptide/nickel transport system permease protein